MPANLLLLGRILALAMLLRGTGLRLPDPFLPFVPGLDLVPGWRWALTVAFFAAAVSLLAGYRPRASALVLGGTLLLGVLSSRVYYGNNRVFTGTALVLLGLSDYRHPDRLFRWLLVLVYFGAGLNKLLDPDWRSGQFLDYWIGGVLHNRVYQQALAVFPSLGLTLSWLTIAGQFGCAAGFLYRPWTRAALAFNLLFQLLLLGITGTTLGEFFYAMAAVTLAFVERPASTRFWLGVTAMVALLGWVEGWPLRLFAAGVALFAVGKRRALWESPKG